VCVFFLNFKFVLFYRAFYHLCKSDALETTSIGGDPSNRETNGAAASAGSKSQRQGAGKGKGKGGSSSDGRNEPTLLLPPLFVLPPPPPPPAYLDDIEAAKTATAAEAAAAKAAAVAVAENKEEGGVPAASASPSSSSSPSPSSFRWHASLVARIAFLQGAGRDGGVGAATVGPSANRISTASAIVWRPASNVLRKFMLPTEVRRAFLFDVSSRVFIQLHTLSESCLLVLSVFFFNAGHIFVAFFIAFCFRIKV
jgi:hypothetical protein